MPRILTSEVPVVSTDDALHTIHSAYQTIEALAAQGTVRWVVRRRRDWIEREGTSMLEITVRFIFLGNVQCTIHSLCKLIRIYK
jgi:hypothetical protein